MTGPAAGLNIYGFTPTYYSFNKLIYSVKLAVREARICFNRKILASSTAARAGSSNRKQNFFRKLRHWWNFSTSLVEHFLSEIFGNARFFLIFAHFLTSLDRMSGIFVFLSQFYVNFRKVTLATGVPLYTRPESGTRVPIMPCGLGVKRFTSQPCLK